MRLIIDRFYLSKPEGKRLERDHIFQPGERYRPIGCPEYESRMISKAMNDMIYFMLQNRLTKFQHAYRQERGVHTALIEV